MMATHVQIWELQGPDTFLSSNNVLESSSLVNLKSQNLPAGPSCFRRLLYALWPAVTWKRFKCCWWRLCENCEVLSRSCDASVRLLSYLSV